MTRLAAAGVQNSLNLEMDRLFIHPRKIRGRWIAIYYNALFMLTQPNIIHPTSFISVKKAQENKKGKTKS